VSAFTIGVRGCQHLGYDAAGYRRSRTTGWGMRVTDGHIAHALGAQSMLDAEVDVVVDGGDLFHWARPMARDIDAALRTDDLLAAAGIPRFGNTGNHDASIGLDLAASAVMHRPELGFRAVYPTTNRAGQGVGPHPGFYEIHHPADGIALHIVSHYGLDPALADQGIVIDPRPVPGMVNLLIAHGITVLEEKLYRVVDAHGEPRTIPVDWFSRGFDAHPISDFHTMGGVTGRESGTGWVAYTGSTVRRGFSDEACSRGWLKIVVDSSGVTYEPQVCWQRPQFDLPVIDASSRSVDDIASIIEANVAGVALVDDETAQLTGDGGAIVRQRIRNATPAQRAGVRSMDSRFRNLASEAIWWGLHFPPVPIAAPKPVRSGSNAPGLGVRRTNFAGELKQRGDRLAAALNLPSEMRAAALAGATTITESIVVEDTTAERESSE